MSTSGGLSRRRVGANGGATSSYDDDDNKLSPTNSGSGGGGSRSTTPAPAPQHAHAGSAFEGGNKIAFDPRDLQQDASEEARTGGKLPRLTIMEEVLLLGIKDKQVKPLFFFRCILF
jgi:Golgi phosphoprotein 3